MRLQRKMTSVVLPSNSYNGWVKPNILYIPLIILKFTYNRRNKIKTDKLAFIDYMFFIMFSERTSLRISVHEIPTCFTLLDEAERVECAVKTSISMPSLGMVLLIHRDIVLLMHL